MEEAIGSNIRLQLKDIVLLIYLLTLIMWTFFGGNVYLYILIFLGNAFLITFILRVQIRMWLLYLILYFFIIGYLLLALKDGVIIGGASGNILITTANIGVCFYILKNNPSTHLVKLIFWGISSYMLYCWVRDKSFDSLFPTASENYVSVVMLFFVSLYYYIEKENSSPESKLNIAFLFPAVVTFIISIIAEGRGGILSSTILIIGVTIVFCKKNKYKMPLNFFSFLVFVIILIIFLFVELSSLNSNYGTFLDEIGFGKFIDKGLDSDGRNEITSAYLSNMDVSSFIIGGEWKSAYLYFSSGNLHNSFLRGHLMLGVIFIAFIILSIFSIIYYCIKKNILYATLTICILVRGFTDTILLPGYFDFILLLIVVHPFIINSKKMKFPKLN